MKIDKNKTYSVEEFARLFKLSADHIRRCCRGYKDPRTEKIYQLPDGWVSNQRRKKGDWEISYVGNEPLPPEPISRTTTWGMDIHQMCSAIERLSPTNFGNKGTEFDEHVESKKFSVLRDVLILQELERKIGPISPKDSPYVACENRLLELLRDSEIAGLLSRRWANRIIVDRFDSVPDVLERMEETETILSPIKNLNGLLSKLRECYIAAVEKGQPISIQLSFKKDGSWATGRTGIDSGGTSPFLDLYLEGKVKAPPSAPADSIEGLLYLTWCFDLHARTDLPEAFPAGWLNIWLDSETDGIDRLRRRCLYCGKELVNPRKNKRYCEKGNHRSSYSKWIQELVHLKTSGEENKVNEKLKTRLESALINLKS